MKAWTNSFWFLIAILALLAGTTQLFFIAPANQKREALLGDTAEKRAALANLDRTIRSIRDMNAKLASLQQTVLVFDSRLRSGQDLNRAIEDIWRLTQANSLESKSVRTPTERRTQDFREQEIDLTLAGNFNSFYQFFVQLEDLKQIARIKKLNLTKTNGREGEIQAELTLSVYFAPEPG